MMIGDRKVVGMGPFINNFLVACGDGRNFSVPVVENFELLLIAVTTFVFTEETKIP